MDRIEIRLLGPLRVRRSDGSLVEAHEWRTRKSADLLMLLALHAGEPVRVDRLLEALWPDAEPERGRASLRTALSQLRKALRQDPFERDRRGPVLSGVWVDSHVFDDLAAQAHRAWEQADAEQVLAAAGEAESLCLSHLLPDADGTWATPYRERHRAVHRDLLGDAGEAALALHRPREAADSAERLLQLDPFQERGCRTLMLAATRIGEVDRALQAYRTCAERLAEELGADPSAQTQAVYLQVLRAGPVPDRPVPFVGRDAELASLRARLADRTGGLLVVHGEQGVGSTSLVEHALAGLEGTGLEGTGLDGAGTDDARLDGVDGVDGVTVLRGTGAALAALLGEARRQPAGHRVLVVDRLDAADAVQLQALLRLASDEVSVLATCPTSALASPSVLSQALVEAGATGHAWTLRVPPLSGAELRQLAAVVLAGEPGDELAQGLERQARGRPGRALALMDDWLARGAVVGTGSGLALVPPGGATTAAETRQGLARLQERVSGQAWDLLEAVAVLDAHAAPALLARMTDLPADAVDRALAELADQSVLMVGQGRVELRDPLLRVALLEWVRPSVRSALHARSARLGELPPEAQADHFGAAGEPAHAASAALAAADELAAAGRVEQACERLQRLLDDGSELDPALRLHVRERIGDHLAQLGDAEAAGAVYGSVADDAREQGHGDVARLVDKAAQPLGRPTLHLRTVAELAVAVPAVPDVQELEHQLLVRIETARRAGDDAGVVAGQVELCAVVLGPQRRLGELARAAEEARRAAPTPQLRAQAVLAAAEPEVLLGGASRWVPALLEAVTASRGEGALATDLLPGRLLALAMHDLGQDGTVGVPDGQGWLVARVLLERGSPNAAERALGPPPLGGSACAVVCDVVTRARVLLAQGQQAAGRDLLRKALDLTVGLGVGLLLPEVAALLAAEEVEDDEAAVEHLELAELSLGAAAFPRERIALLLGRAAVRARSRGPAAAADVAQSASRLAEAAGLVHLAAAADRVAEGYRDGIVQGARSPRRSETARSTSQARWGGEPGGAAAAAVPPARRHGDSPRLDLAGATPAVLGLRRRATDRFQPLRSWPS